MKLIIFYFTIFVLYVVYFLFIRKYFNSCSFIKRFFFFLTISCFIFKLVTTYLTYRAHYSMLDDDFNFVKFITQIVALVVEDKVQFVISYTFLIIFVDKVVDPYIYPRILPTIFKYVPHLHPYVYIPKESKHKYPYPYDDQSDESKPFDDPSDSSDSFDSLF